MVRIVTFLAIRQSDPIIILASLKRKFAFPFMVVFCPICILSTEPKKFKFVLLGATKNEIRLVEEFCHGLNNPISVVNICGKSKIDELPSIVNDLDLLVTNDTGTMHLAIALGKKTISLFGPTNLNEFGPYQDYNIHRVVNTGNPRFVQDRQIDFKSLNLMEKISIDQVYSEIKRAI